MPETPDQPKIIVDEDWKSQVERERKAARQVGSGTASTSSSGSAAASEPGAKPQPAATAEPADAPLPPPSLTFLFTTLATQAMIALGQVPNPITGKADVRLNQAKHYIDTLAMLEEKTAGHRTADESTLLTEVLHQLRMAFVVVGDKARA